MKSPMRRIGQLRGRANLNALWLHLLGQSNVVHHADSLRQQAWFAGVKYDYFRSDEGEALIMELWDKNPELSLFSVLADAWVQHHIRNNICF